MSEHTYTADIDGSHYVRVPDNWHGKVTVTWTEPPEPTGRWVVTDGAGGEWPVWQPGDGRQWTIRQLVGGCHTAEIDRAEAALVDLIESDHLPPQMPSVDDIDDFLLGNGYIPHSPMYSRREVIRGTLDAIAALTPGRDDAAAE